MLYNVRTVTIWGANNQMVAWGLKKSYEKNLGIINDDTNYMPEAL